MRILTLFLVLIFLTPSAFAQEKKINLDQWSTLPILHEGRVKPLDSFARVMLKTFSGKESAEGLNAQEWLAESLFMPGVAVDREIFKIQNAATLGLIEKDKKFYSYSELVTLIRKKEKPIQDLLRQEQANWTPEQSNLMAQYENFILYTQILRSLTLILPLNIQTPDKFSRQIETGNFLNYKKIQTDIERKVKKIIRRKGTDIEKYTAEEKELSILSYQIQTLEEGGKNNVLLRIIPANWDNLNGEWLSPWQALQTGKNAPETLGYIEKWQKLTISYRDKNAESWVETINNLSDFDDLKTKLETEKLYNLLHLLVVAGLLYVFSLFLLVLANFINNIKFIKLSFYFLSAGFIAHFVHIIFRIYILARPPVGTLYESILFVALICVAGCIFLESKQKNSIGILLGSLSGIILLGTATAFANEDTMGTLVAVLNTNFWLTTHVLCITIGYGWCLIASLLAHYYLIRNALAPKTAGEQYLLKRNIKTLVILSLLFTTIGTALGGIWADQSWGRFWGWDPKENGALLIVLWLIWLLHGRISSHISETGFIVGTAFLSVIVVLAWFGVNLLSVGLHSYGFISGIAWGIGLFCAFEILLISWLWLSNHKKGKLPE